MKTSLTYLKNHLVCFGAAVLLLVSVSTTKAQILLTINDLDASNVIITATGTAPSQNASGTFGDGVDLLDFLTTAQTGGAGPFTTSLSTGDLSEGQTLDSFFVDDLTSTTGVFANVSLNLFNSTTGGTETFTSGVGGAAAFTGTLTLDLTGFALPTDGTTGDIITGFDGSPSGEGGAGITPNTQIGQWEVVNGTVAAPEPSTWLLMSVGLAILVCFRARFRSLRK
jgi:hypothetical protein